MEDTAVQQVDSDTKEKIRLELVLYKEVATLVNKIAKANAKSITETGLPISSNVFLRDWIALLKNHYKRVSESFFGNIELDTIDSDDNELSESEEGDVLIALDQWGNNKSEINAGIITNTTQEQMNQALEDAKRVLMQQDQSLDNRTIAMTATLFFLKKRESRSKLIALVETQSAAETTKLFESVALSGENPTLLLGPSRATLKTKTIKKWHTVGDDRVRPHHSEAEGKTKTLGEPFTVGGEKLMFPGDASLGATAGNLMNCRCSLTYKIERVRTP